MLLIELMNNENLLKAESDFDRANSGNIIELCREYLQILNDYRESLYKLRGSPEINFQQSSSLAREKIEQVRKDIRSKVEMTTRKRNQIESLLQSFTFISGYEAVRTFNQLRYNGFEDWELAGNSVYSSKPGTFEKLTIPEAADRASLLRREAYIADKTVFFK